MSAFEITMMIILLVFGVFLVVSMLLQKGSSELSGTIAGGNRQNSYVRERETGRARASRILTTLTTVVGIAFVVIVLAAYVIQPDYGNLNAGNEWHSSSTFFKNM